MDALLGGPHRQNRRGPRGIQLAHHGEELGLSGIGDRQLQAAGLQSRWGLQQGGLDRADLIWIR